MKAIAFLFLVCFSVHAFAQQKNDRMRQKLRGEVKTVTEYEYAVAGEGKGELKSKRVYEYNKAGNRTALVTYSPSGELTSRSVYQYNEVTGRLENVKSYRADGGLNVTTVYGYDKAGNEVTDSSTDPSGTLFMTSKSKYDLNGNRIVYDRFNQFGHLFLRSNLKYDKKGNEVQEREYDSHESLQFITTYEYGSYDKQGNWLSRTTLKNDVPRIIIERELAY